MSEPTAQELMQRIESLEATCDRLQRQITRMEEQGHNDFRDCMGRVEDAERNIDRLWQQIDRP